MIQNSFNGNATLYLIPTPIGNLEDITLRAINTLKLVDYILCEDTRVTSLLLKHLKISKRLVSCHEFNEDKIKDKILKDLLLGKNIGLVTDQGSPIISDPGYRVVKYLTDNNVNVVALPGATAFVPAIMCSGINSNHFLFYGFLNNKHSKRMNELQLLKNNPYTLVFYESVHRIKDALNDIYEVFGNREVCLCRELSKVHEEIIRKPISDLISDGFTEKGEFVLIVQGNTEKSDFSNISVEEHVKMYLDEGLEEKEAIKAVAKDRKTKKSDIYKQYHINK